MFRSWYKKGYEEQRTSKRRGSCENARLIHGIDKGAIMNTEASLSASKSASPRNLGACRRHGMQAV